MCNAISYANAMLDLHKLSVFRRVISAGSFSKAAHELLMTQSAVSQHIQDLERMLGISLFVRQARGALPTEAGQRLAHYADQILQTVSAAELELTNIRESGLRRLNISATTGAGTYVIPAWITQFLTAHPNIRTQLTTGLMHEVIADLDRRNCDMAILESSPDELNQHRTIQTQQFGTSETVLIVGRNHPLWGSAGVALDSLSSTAMVAREADSQTRVWLDELLTNGGCTPLVVATFDSIEAIKRAVMFDHVCAFLPDYAIQNELSSGVVWAIRFGDSFVRTLSVAFRRDEPLSPVSAAFVQTLQSVTQA